MLFKSRQDTSSEIPHHAGLDIAIQNKNIITVIELTYQFKINLIKSNLYKQKRYENLQSEFLILSPLFRTLFLEISSPGFAGHETNKRGWN